MTTDSAPRPEPLGDSDEPARLGAAVKDHAGRLWLRGHRVWRPADSPRGHGRLNWLALVAEHGPLVLDRDTAAYEAAHRARRHRRSQHTPSGVSEAP